MLVTKLTRELERRYFIQAASSERQPETLDLHQRVYQSMKKLFINVEAEEITLTQLVYPVM